MGLKEVPKIIILSYGFSENINLIQNIGTISTIGTKNMCNWN